MASSWQFPAKMWTRRAFVHCILTACIASSGCTPLKDDLPVDDASAADANAADGPFNGIPADATTDAHDGGAVLTEAGVHYDAGEPTGFTLATSQTRNNIVRGETTKLELSVARHGGILGGPIDITVPGLPAGVSADPLTIPGTASIATLTLRATASALLTRRLPFTIEGHFAFYKATAPITLLVQSRTGSVDATFGQDGVTTIALGASTLGIGPQGLAIQNDGKILLCGSAQRANEQTEALALARLSPDGTLDPGFAFKGTALVTFEGHDKDVCTAVKEVDKGRIIVSGFASAQNTHQLLAARFMETGSVDLTFGKGSGCFISLLESPEAKSFVLAIQPNGHIVLGGYGKGGSALVRLDADGAMDIFGPSGSGTILGVTSDHGAYASSAILGLALHADGRIAASASGGAGFQAIRASADGALDLSYGVSGVAETVGGAQVYASQLALQPDDKVVLSGQRPAVGATTSAIQLARFNVDGSLDQAFGSGGMATTDISGSNVSARAIALLPDGHIAIAAALPGFGAVRYTPAGVLDTSFAGFGFAEPSVGSDSIAEAVAVDDEGRILIAGVANDGTRQNAVVVRLAP